VYIVGGGELGLNGGIIQFDLESQGWNFFPVQGFPSNGERFYESAATYVEKQNRIYFFGGRIGSEYSDGIWWIDLEPLRPTTTQPTTTPTTTQPTTTPTTTQPTTTSTTTEPTTTPTTTEPTTTPTSTTTGSTAGSEEPTVDLSTSTTTTPKHWNFFSSFCKFYRFVIIY
jgi:hypothetical protein